MQTQTSNTLHNAIMEAGSKDRPPMLAPGWKEKKVSDADGNLTTTAERVFEMYKNVKQDIRDQLNAEAEAVQIILTGIDNDIYSTVDACPNACEMWKAIERLKHDESINVQDLETNLYWEFGKFTSKDGESLESYYSRFYKMMNELIRNQCKNQELKTVSYHKLYDILKQHQHEVNEIRAEKIARVANPLALDNSIRINRNAGCESQRSGNVAGARETVGSSMVQKSRIQCYNCKEFRHASRECQKPKRAKDAAYHREKMLLCKQEEAGIQ
nr:retrovirus-related Pol polyprotein from transposon TNT 1-94 [Tanacetum cinerariifolium]